MKKYLWGKNIAQSCCKAFLKYNNNKGDENMILEDYIEKYGENYSAQTRKDAHLSYIEKAMHNPSYRDEPPIYMDKEYKGILYIILVTFW